MQLEPREICSEKFRRLNACVIIPTYNNASTIAAVIKDVAGFTDDIIVVNDGSTDNTENIVAQFQSVQMIGYKKNAGKGMALRKGFAYALEKNYDFAITFDADSQHYAKDLPLFLDKLEAEKNVIVIGKRDLQQPNVPGKSSFGNKFSSFWFRVETGIKQGDTQSGYRLYPLQSLKNIHFITVKYEFEIEVLVRAAWKDIGIRTIPVSVYYPPAGERVSHFRPFKDTLRISLLNTCLVLVAFFYIRPRNFFRALFNKKKNKEHVSRSILQASCSSQIKILLIALSLFLVFSRQS